MTDDKRAIHDRLKNLLRHAHAPYSGFKVAAAAIDEQGNAHFGVNVENQSFPVGTCAEAGALSALRVGGGARVVRLYLLSEPNIEVVPCGACRQRLAELGDASTVVVTFSANGDEISYPMEKLFPHSFRFR